MNFDFDKVLEGLSDTISSFDLRYCLMILLFLIDEVFPVCRKEGLDTFREHIIYCRELSCFKYQHDFVKDVFLNIFWHMEVYVKKEMLVNFLIDS